MTSEEDIKGFVSRWSNRKVAVREADKSETVKDLGLRKPDQDALPAEVKDTPQIEAGEEEFVPTEEDVDKLDINSDFSKFLKTSVPQHIKRLALNKLWRTDPAFGVVDGLLEYGEDYSDMSNKGAAIQSAYQAGKGYLNRDDKTGAEPDDEIIAADGDEVFEKHEHVADDEKDDAAAGAAARTNATALDDEGDTEDGKDNLA